MQEVAIIGAGALGGELAFVLARQDAAHTIRLIDDARNLAVGKALDIMQAAPIEQFAASVVAGSDVSEAAGADVVVVARELEPPDGTQILKRLSSANGRAPIVCAAASHRHAIELGVRELGIHRMRLVGSAPEALASALRALVALEADTSPASVALTVLGAPPDQTVVPWEDAAIGGLSVTRVLDAAARRRLDARVVPLWPPGPLALATAAAAVVAGLLGRSRREVSVFVGPDDSGGRKMRAAALPVRLHPGGVAAVTIPALSAHERVALDNALLL
jgi:malate dehydrogenase